MPSPPEILRQIYNRLYYDHISGFFEGWVKTYQCERVMARPLTPDYPYDPEIKLLRSIGLSSDPMMDIGANDGHYSLALESVVGPDNLYLFEPLPIYRRYLSRRFPGASVFCCALSDASTTTTLRVPYISGRKYPTRATLSTHRERGESGADEITIETRTLDDVTDAHGIDCISLIKIDVEGHELRVLEGATSTLQRCQPLLLVEIEARHHERPISRIFDRLAELDYDGFFLHAETLEMRPIRRFEVERHQRIQDLKDRNFQAYVNNFFFAPTATSDDFLHRAETFLTAEREALA